MRTRGGIIRRRIATALAGFAACALAVGGITYALVPAGGTVPGNFIGAGHLVLQVNKGQGSDLNIGNLMPGAPQRGEQLIAADMSGVGTADLILALSGRPVDAFTAQTSLTVYYSDPEPARGIRWTGDTCTPIGGYAHQISYPDLAVLARARTTSLGTLTDDDNALCVRYEFELDAAAGNDVQGESVDLAMGYTIEQTSAGTS